MQFMAGILGFVSFASGLVVQLIDFAMVATMDIANLLRQAVTRLSTIMRGTPPPRK